MPTGTEKYKQDPRSPQELAKAILDHEFTPRTDREYSLSLREKLMTDYQSDNEIEEASALLWALKRMEANITGGREDINRLTHDLQVIDAYKIETSKWRDHDAKKLCGKEGPYAEFLQRAAAESMVEPGRRK